MSVFEFLLKELGSHIKQRFFSIDFYCIPKAVMIIDKNIEYTDDCIYIGSWKDIKEAVSTGSAPKYTTFFIPLNDSALPKDTYLITSHNVVFTDLSVNALNNSISTALIKLYKMENNETNLVFNNFLYDILLKNKTHFEDIKEMASALDNKLQQYFNFIIISFADKKVLMHKTPEMFSMLNRIFSGCNMSVFSKKIVILYTQNERYSKPPAHMMAALEDFLETYDGTAVTGTPFRNYSMIKTEYYLGSNLLRIVSNLNDKGTSKIFSEDNFGPYLIIDLCSRKYEEMFANNDIIYLSHPGLIALSRYDIKHNTNLRDILHCYLQNDGNLSKTAKEMFMHRNTILNKINKITEIIDDDLGNYSVRFRLMFSFMIIKYYEQYKHLQLKL